MAQAKVSPPKTYAQTKVDQGGLMRCCLATISDYLSVHSAETPQPGLILDCKFQKPGNAQIILDQNSIWRWNRPDSLFAPKAGS